MEPILKIENLTHTYSAWTPFERRAVDGVNLEVAPGEFLGVIGHTGSGKSTLVKAVLGLVPMAGGGIEVLGTSIDDVSVKATTTEGLGFAGEGQGIACYAVCSIIKERA